MFGSVNYKEANDWSDGISVRKDILITPEDGTRDRLISLANHLSLRFILTPVVVINIFNDETAAQSYDKQFIDDEQKQFAFAHWPARYVKSWSAGVNLLEVYPDSDHSKPERIAY